MLSGSAPPHLLWWWTICGHDFLFSRWLSTWKVGEGVALCPPCLPALSTETQEQIIPMCPVCAHHSPGFPPECSSELPAQSFLLNPLCRGQGSRELDCAQEIGGDGLEEEGSRGRDWSQGQGCSPKPGGFSLSLTLHPLGLKVQ